MKKKLISYNDVNKERRISTILGSLSDGDDVALVSDAGTPGVSDPAYRVVTAALDEGYEVISIPGPSAVLSALVISGLPLDRFTFEGFLPQKNGARIKRLQSLCNESRTVIFYESPYRIEKLLVQILETLGDRHVSVSRELTKLHEETVRGPVSNVLTLIRSKKPRGEYTVVVQGNTGD